MGGSRGFAWAQNDPSGSKGVTRSLDHIKVTRPRGSCCLSPSQLLQEVLGDPEVLGPPMGPEIQEGPDGEDSV